MAANMIALILISAHLIVSGAVNEDFYTDLLYINSCNKTSPISLDAMNKVLIHKQLDENNSSNFKCFLFCLFNKYNWMDEDGGFLIHEIRNVLEQVELETASLEYILFKCTAVDSVDKCERSFKFVECFWEKSAQKQTEDDQFLYQMMDKKK